MCVIESIALVPNNVLYVCQELNWLKKNKIL